MLKDQIRHYREEKKLTQEELADKIHVSRSLVAKWEQGRGVPSSEDFEALCSALEISVSDIVPYQTVVETNKKNIKKRNIIVSLVAIILLLVMVWIIVDNVDQTDFKRDLYIGEIYLGRWKFDASPESTTGYVYAPESVSGKNVDKIEEAIIDNAYYRGKVVYKQNLLNNRFGMDSYVGKECYVLAKGNQTFLVLKENDTLYIKNFQLSMVGLYGDVVPDKYDVYGDEVYYIAGITDNIIKTNKKKYYCGEEYEPAYTIEEMKILYANSEIDESGKCLTIKDATVIGFVDYKFDLKVHYLDNCNITFELIVK
ncbi:MAG: helix-turn-helix domain-containing protein [Clostridia bacterium]|nr:helix-turn-helix domain-containing protein [Clostridia bacterium]